jgi:hypothetical protein
MVSAGHCARWPLRLDLRSRLVARGRIDVAKQPTAERGGISEGCESKGCVRCATQYWWPLATASRP